MQFISVSVHLAGKYKDTILMSALEMGLLWSPEPCKSLTVCKDADHKYWSDNKTL